MLRIKKYGYTSFIFMVRLVIFEFSLLNKEALLETKINTNLKKDKLLFKFSISLFTKLISF